MEAIFKKQWRNRRRSSLLIEDNRYYNNETSANPDQEDGLNLLGND